MPCGDRDNLEPAFAYQRAQRLTFFRNNSNQTSLVIKLIDTLSPTPPRNRRGRAFLHVHAFLCVVRFDSQPHTNSRPNRQRQSSGFNLLGWPDCITFVGIGDDRRLDRPRIAGVNAPYRARIRDRRVDRVRIYVMSRR